MTTDEDRARWARLREQGRRVQDAIHALAAEVGVGDDPLDWLAFVTGTIREPEPESGEVPPFSYRFHLAKTQALDHATGTWPAIAEAMGEVEPGGDARKAGQRVRSRYVDNSRRLAGHMAAHGKGGDSS